jgi:hypothetical protein
LLEFINKKNPDKFFGHDKPRKPKIRRENIKPYINPNLRIKAKKRDEPKLNYS